MDFISRTNSFGLEQVLHVAGYGRLITLFGSIETGVLSAIAALLAILMIRKEHSKLRLIISIIINLAALILTQQRGSLAAFFVFFLALLIDSEVKKERLIKPSTILFIVSIVVAVFAVLAHYKPVVLDWIITRITNPAAAFTQRNDYQWEVVAKDTNIIQWIFGRGLGSRGFFVENNDIYHRIFDNMYYNILAETGIIGLILFLGIIFNCTQKTLSKMSINGMYAVAIFIICVQGLGTTMIYYPQIMAIFWFSVGMIYHFRVSESNERIEE